VGPRTRTPTAFAAARDAINHLCVCGLSARELLSQVAERLGRVIPYHARAWSPLDPETVLPTDLVNPTASARLLTQLFDNEIFTPDFAKFADIAQRRRPVLTLWEATGGDLCRSPRHRDIHRPLGYGDDLRAVFRSGDLPLAAFCMSRREDQPPFSRQEVALVASICETVGAGLRAAIALAAVQAEPKDDDPPGVIVLMDDDRVESLTEEARAWLARLPDPGARLELPAAVYTVARRVRAAAAGVAAGPPWLRVPTVSGRWLTLHGARLDGIEGGPGRVAVVLQAAGSSRVASLLMELHGLTPRETEVAQLMVRGMATEDIAGRLCISRHTVRDHVQAAFDKLRVSSRGELTALLTATVARPNGHP
jgi:DNA-binding CsgD family transcriptional regulator